MREICGMISRPDDEYKPGNSLHWVCIDNTLIHFSINNTQYVWKLYEVYLSDSVNFTNRYITGHSVIDMANQY